MQNSSESSIAQIELFSDNIFYVTVKPSAIINRVNARKLVYTTNDLFEDKTKFRAGIYDLTNIDHITDDARACLSDNPDMKGTIVAIALISDSFLGKMVSNLFITVDTPNSYPIQFFDSSAQAEIWINEQITKAKTGSLSQRE
ncbi:hypothetical protein OAE48_01100 [Flavobacteriales bacterium]|nr:hypothetical protein [Flavobacteriales bacterium]